MVPRIVLSLLAFGLSAQLHAAGDATAGAVKAATCLGCHGLPGYTNVYPTYKVPKLAGQHADYLVLALTAYKTGERKHKTMQAQAASLSSRDMADIAAYFSTAGK